jgi:hypothetical protein
MKMEDKILEGLLDLEIGSECQELNLLAASCRVATTMTKLAPEDTDELNELEDLED